MAPATPEELTAAAEAGATRALERRDSNPPGPASDPGAQGTTIKTTTVKRTRDVSRLTWPTAILVSSVSMAVGIGIAWGSGTKETAVNSRALEQLDKKVEALDKAKAEKDAAEKVEERVRAVENAATANTEQHSAIKIKVGELTTAVEALKTAQEAANRKLDRLLEKTK